MKKTLLVAMLLAVATSAAAQSVPAHPDPNPWPICPEGTWGCPGPGGEAS